MFLSRIRSFPASTPPKRDDWPTVTPSKRDNWPIVGQLCEDKLAVRFLFSPHERALQPKEQSTAGDANDGERRKSDRQDDCGRRGSKDGDSVGDLHDHNEEKVDEPVTE